MRICLLALYNAISTNINPDKFRQHRKSIPRFLAHPDHERLEMADEAYNVPVPFEIKASASTLNPKK